MKVGYFLASWSWPQPWPRESVFDSVNVFVRGLLAVNDNTPRRPADSTTVPAC